MFRKTALQIHTLLFSFLVLWAASGPVSVQAASFYEGKMIKIYTSASPGGGFDTFARLLARHYGRYIPGNPRTIVINMPGGAHLVAANRIYTMQPGDGLTIVNFHFGKVIQAYTGDPLVKFDPLKYQWLGDPTIGGLPQILWVRTDLDIHSMEDIKKRQEPLALGSTGMGTSPAVAAEFLKLLGYPINNVTGYRGSANTFAALERQELHGRIISQSTMETVYRRFLDRGFVRPVLSMGSDPRIKPLKGVPTLDDLDMTADQRELAKFMVSTFSLLRTYAVPPGTPPDRVQILRQAFLKALQSPKLLKDAKRQGVVVAPLSGEEVAKVVRDFSQTPVEVLESFKRLSGMKN